MDPEDAYLREDFNQCFQQMRHYDSHFITIVNLIFGGFGATIIVAVSFLSSTTKNITIVFFGSGLLFILTWIAGSLMLAFLLRNRNYFTQVTRYINEIRGYYLSSDRIAENYTGPAFFRNETGMPTSSKVPPLFSPWSTQTLLMYFVAFGNSLFLGAGATSLAICNFSVSDITLLQTASDLAKGDAELFLAIFLVVFATSFLFEFLYICWYLRTNDRLRAEDAWWKKEHPKT